MVAPSAPPSSAIKENLACAQENKKRAEGAFMKRQQTLFGSWGVGSPEQKQPIEDTTPFKCTTCGRAFSHAGAVANHAKTHDPDPGPRQPVSSLLLAQIEWLREVKARQEAAKGGEDGDSGCEDGEEADDEDVADGVVAEGRRGRPRRLRSNVKYKYRVLKLYDTAQEEMFKEAEKNGSRLPNKAEIFARLEQNGLSEKPSNL